MALNTLPTLGASCSMVLRSRSLLFAFAGLVGTGNSIVIRSSVCAILVRLRADRMSEGLLSRWHLVTKLLGLPQKGDSGLLPTVTSITYSNGLLRYKGSNLIISGITIASGNTANFAQTHNCPIGGAGLSVNASCIASVTFTPTRRNLRTSALRITDNVPNSPQSVAL